MRWSMAILGFFIASTAVAQTNEGDREADEAILREQRLPTKGVELLQILRDRTPSEDTIAQFKKHAAGLRAAAYADRLKATKDLTKMGAVVRPLLENALRDGHGDAETLGRLRQVLDHFPAEKDFTATGAAARLIARDRSPQSLPVLLDFVPYATNEQVRQEIQRSIDAVALVDRKPAPALLHALKDASAARRAAAGEALLRGMGLQAKADMAPLLKDADPLVRYQLGMALVEKHDKSGLPMLIQTVKDSPAERVEYALELLYRVAGEDAPGLYYQGKGNAADVSAAWLQWHDKHHAKLDLAKQLARTELGFTVIATTAVAGIKANGKNKVFELGPDKAVRWEFDGPRSALDIQVIGPNRLLLAEYLDRRVTERDFKGNILKQFSVPLPVGCQRLPNGHTFIVTRQQLLIVDQDGKDVFTWAPQPRSIITAQRLRNGQFAVITGGRCLLLDPEGRELKSFVLGGALYAMGGNIEVLPNGRILVPLYTQNMVVEFDWTGARLWQGNVIRPTSASRLANGNTLVTCTLNSTVVEIDRDSKEVWSYSTDGRPFRSRKR